MTPISGLFGYGRGKYILSGILALILCWGRVAYADPVPSVTANSATSTATIPAGSNLQLRINLNTGGPESAPVDWWVVADSPFGWYYYDLGTETWHADWSATQPCSSQMPLVDVENKTIFDGSYLPAGTYKVYFGIDEVSNCTLDFDRGFYDMVTVDILEANPAGYTEGKWVGSSDDYWFNFTITDGALTQSTVGAQKPAPGVAFTMTGLGGAEISAEGTFSVSGSLSSVGFVFVAGEFKTTSTCEIEIHLLQNNEFVLKDTFTATPSQ